MGTRQARVRLMARSMAVAGGVTVAAALLAAPASAYTDSVLAAHSHQSALSPDGRWVAFSTTSKLVAADTNLKRDVYLKDRTTGTLYLVSDPVGPAAANGDSDPIDTNNKTFASLDVSIAGRFVVFTSRASNLVAGDANGTLDVFRWTRGTGLIELVSKRAGTAVAGNLDSSYPRISGDGQFVAFQSRATDLTALKPTGRIVGTNDRQVLVRDMVAGKSRYVSMKPGGAFPNGSSGQPDISADGRWVAFTSYASDLMAGDTNAKADIYRRHLGTFAIDRISLSSTGTEPTQNSGLPAISGNGRYVAFESGATLAPADTNPTTDVYVRDTRAALPAPLTFWASYAAGGGAPIDSTPARFPAISADGSRVAYSNGDDFAVMSQVNVALWRTTGLLAVIPQQSSPTMSGNGRILTTHWALDPAERIRVGDLGTASYAVKPLISLSGAIATITDGKTGIALVTVNGLPRRLSSVGTIGVASGQTVIAWNGAGVSRTVLIP